MYVFCQSMWIFFLPVAYALTRVQNDAVTVSLISCDVCHYAVDQILDHRSDGDNFRYIDSGDWSPEDVIDEYVKALCDETKKVEGALWRQLDIVPGPSLVDRRPQMQWCGDECHLMSRACFEVLEEAGDALSRGILYGLPRPELYASVCPCESVSRPDGYFFEDQPFRPLTSAGRRELDKALGMLRFAERTGAFPDGDRARRLDEIRRNAYADPDADPWDGGAWGEEAIRQERWKQKREERRKRKLKRKRRRRRRQRRQRSKLKS